jgi:deoxycytidylate deaminase
MCTPPEGGCPRLHTVQTKEGYSNAGCDSQHAETNAIRNLMHDRKPVRAAIYGHDFACPPCEKMLREFGITTIDIVPDGFGTGLRSNTK